MVPISCKASYVSVLISFYFSQSSSVTLRLSFYFYQSTVLVYFCQSTTVSLLLNDYSQPTCSQVAVSKVFGQSAQICKSAKFLAKYKYTLPCSLHQGCKDSLANWEFICVHFCCSRFWHIVICDML